MAVTGLRPRSQPQTSGHGLQHGQQHPVKKHASVPYGLRASGRGGAMPRAASTPNMYRLAEISYADEDPELVWREVAREQIDPDTLRALAQFFRTTGPPMARAPSMDTQPDCFRVPSDKKRWSIQSLRKGRRSRQPTSLQAPLPENAVRSTTAAGHRYIAISVPPPEKPRDRRRDSLQSLRGGARNSVSSSYSRTIEHRWPPRISSKQAFSPVRLRFELAEEDEQQQEQQPQEQQEQQEDHLKSKRDTDDYTTRASTLRLYGNVLRFLNSGPDGDDSAESGPDEQETPQVTKDNPKKDTGPVASPEPPHDTGKTLQTQVSPSITLDRSPPPAPPPAKFSLSPTIRSPEPQSPKTRLQYESPKSNKRDAAPVPAVVTGQSHARPSSAISNKSMPGLDTSRPLKPPKPPARSSKRPTNFLAVNPSLEVPKVPLIPESPGFPAFLANMSFPSPPDSSPSHSARNSISSSIPSPTPSTPPTAKTLPFRADPNASLDGRIMQSKRPALRAYKSDGVLQNVYSPPEPFLNTDGSMSDQASTLSSPKTVRRAGGGSRPGSAGSSRTAKPEADGDIAPCDTTYDGTRDLNSVESESRHTKEIAVSITESMDSDAMSADVPTAQFATSKRESYSSMTILDRKRSRWSLIRDPGATIRDVSTEDEGRHPESQRPESVSSAGTSEMTKTLAERRRQRRAKVKEKVQKDLGASTVNTLKVPTLGGVADAADSPVLGWFNQGAEHENLEMNKRKASLHGPSPLAQMPASEESQTTTAEPSSCSSTRRSSIYEDAAQAVPETSLEDDSVAASTEQTENEISLADSVTNDSVTNDSIPATRPTSEMQLTTTRLSLSAIMVVANIEGNNQAPEPQRPRSLLNPSSPPLRLTRGPSVRGDNRKPRPVPIKVAPSPVPKAARSASRLSKSIPSVPTPPLSPDSASSRRMSLPSTGSYLTPSTSHHPWNRPSIDASMPSTLSKERETEWLQAHQKETAHEWRLAALKERMRIQRLALEKDLQEDREFKGMPLLKDIEAAAADKEREHRHELKEKHSSSSLGSAASATRTNRLDALRQLNANAPSNKSLPEQTETAVVEDKRASADSDVFYDAEGGGIEKRLNRLEQNCDAWMGAIKSNLENMNRMLGEMQRQSVGRELTMKLMDSALAAADASARSSARRHATIASLYSEIGRGGFDEAEEDAALAVAAAGGSGQ